MTKGASARRPFSFLASRGVRSPHGLQRLVRGGETLGAAQATKRPGRMDGRLALTRTASSAPHLRPAATTLTAAAHRCRQACTPTSKHRRGRGLPDHIEPLVCGAIAGVPREPRGGRRHSRPRPQHRLAGQGAGAQGRPQRTLPLRQRQEIQGVPRQVGLISGFALPAADGGCKSSLPYLSLIG